MYEFKGLRLLFLLLDIFVYRMHFHLNNIVFDSFQLKLTNKENHWYNFGTENLQQ